MINWGPPKIILDYWQHVGRAGRDGQCSQAFLYLPTRAMDSRRVESSVLELVNNGDSQCIRKLCAIYRYMVFRTKTLLFNVVVATVALFVAIHHNF